MKIERQTLLDQLRLLKPALADKSPVEGLNHIWLSGETATAFNDIIGIQVWCPASVDGGVMGSTLLGLLEASTAKDVELDVDSSDGGSALVLKMAGSKARLPLLPPDRAVFAFPEDPPKGFDVAEAFTVALKHVMMAVATDGDNMGITFAPEKTALAVYATDGMTIAWSRVSKPKGYTAKRLVLSPLFCAQLDALNGGGMSLSLTADYALAADNQSGAVLFGRLVEVPKELDFAATIAANVPDDEKGAPLPEKLAVSLDRAEVLVNGVQRCAVQTTVKQGVLRLRLKSDLGELNEAIKLDGPHPDASGEFNGSFIRRGLARTNSFIMSERCFAMLGEGDCGFMVAASVK